MSRKIKAMSPEEAREMFHKALGLHDWSWARLTGRPMMVLVAATLVQLYGILHSQWTPLELMLLYLAEIVAFAFWYGVRATLIDGTVSVFLAPTVICAVAIGMVSMILILLGEYDLRAGARSVQLPALILFAVYAWQAYLAYRSGSLDAHDETEALRITIVIGLYTNVGIFTILACVIADKGYHVQAGGMIGLVVVRFMVEMMLRTRLEFE